MMPLCGGVEKVFFESDKLFLRHFHFSKTEERKKMSENNCEHAAEDHLFEFLHSLLICVLLVVPARRVQEKRKRSD